MIDLPSSEHVTGLAALVSAAALLLHALRAVIPELVKAMRARADSMRTDAETRSRAEQAREVAESDLRDRLDACEREHKAARVSMRHAEARHAEEISTLRGQLEALRSELDDLRRSMTAGHSRQT